MTLTFGNSMGPLYPLGLLTVAAAGTPLALSTNVSGDTGFGTPSTGIAPLTTKGVPSPVMCNKIIVHALVGNSGANIYLVFKGQGAAAGGGTSVIMVIPKGTTQILSMPENAGNPVSIDRLAIDADTTGDKAYVTLVMG
jgi:hypothetical protein